MLTVWRFSCVPCVIRTVACAKKVRSGTFTTPAASFAAPRVRGDASLSEPLPAAFGESADDDGSSSSP